MAYLEQPIKRKKPYTEVYVFRGQKMLDFIKNQIEADTKLSSNG